MASRSKKSKLQNDPGDEIVYSGQALDIAAGWLGIKDVEAELKHEDSKQKINSGAAGRPYNKHMGLGSKGPSKHQSGVAGVEHRLGKKVFMSSKSRIGSGNQEINATNNTRYWNGGSGKKNNDNNPSQGKADEDGSSDESEGRGAAIGKGKKRNDIASMRADLLASGGSKKRKKNRGR